MANINTSVHYQQVMSLALEDRSPGYQDLASASNALLAVMNRDGLWKDYSGPRIRERLQFDSQDIQWYSSWDFLLAPPKDIFNDAYFTPKSAVVPVSLPGDELLDNSGQNQILDVLEEQIEAAERAMSDGMDAGLHGDGTANGGKQITGLRVAVPTVTNSGSYGGISRVDHAIWRTTTFDAHSFATDIGTQVSSTTIRRFLNRIMTQRSRNSRGADILLMSTEHYEAYDAATVAIQRINDETKIGKLGFQTLKYYGAGRTAEIVLDGGVGSNMPANTTYGLESKSFRLRVHPDRKFSKLFEGDGQRPINQDGLVNYIGFRGELTQVNPLFNWKFYDSNPAA